MGKCHNCDQYDYTTHNCPIFCDVIRNTLDDIKADERNKTIDEIINGYKNACKQDIEAREHGNMFPHNVDNFWKQLKGE